MLIRSVHQPPIKFREDHHDLVLLQIRYRVVEDHASIELFVRNVSVVSNKDLEIGGADLRKKLSGTPSVSHDIRDDR